MSTCEDFTGTEYLLPNPSINIQILFSGLNTIPIVQVGISLLNTRQFIFADHFLYSNDLYRLDHVVIFQGESRD